MLKTVYGARVSKGWGPFFLVLTSCFFYSFFLQWTLHTFASLPLCMSQNLDTGGCGVARNSRPTTAVAPQHPVVREAECHHPLASLGCVRSSPDATSDIKQGENASVHVGSRSEPERRIGLEFEQAQRTAISTARSLQQPKKCRQQSLQQTARVDRPM